MLRSGAWKNAVFKKYNFEAEGLQLNGGALHPLLKVREEIRNIFLEMGCVGSLGRPFISIRLTMVQFRRDANILFRRIRFLVLRLIVRSPAAPRA